MQWSRWRGTVKILARCHHVVTAQGTLSLEWVSSFDSRKWLSLWQHLFPHLQKLKDQTHMFIKSPPVWLSRILFCRLLRVKMRCMWTCVWIWGLCVSYRGLLPFQSSKILPLLENTNRGHQDLILGELFLEAEFWLSGRSLSKALSPQERWRFCSPSDTAVTSALPSCLVLGCMLQFLCLELLPPGCLPLLGMGGWWHLWKQNSD